MKKDKTNPKATNFRTWKSGKSWLYASTIVAALAGGTVLKTNVKADSLQDQKVATLSLASDARTTSMAVQVNTEMTSIATSDQIVDSSDACSPSFNNESAVSEPSTNTTRLENSASNSSFIVSESNSVSQNSSNVEQATLTTSKASSLDLDTTSQSSISFRGNTITSSMSSQFPASISSAIITTASISSSAAKVDSVLGSLESQAASIVNEKMTSLSVTEANASLIDVNVASIASDMGSYYNLTLGSAVTQLVSVVGVQGVVSGVQDLLEIVSPYLSSVPGASSIIAPINSVISGINNALNIASVLGLPTSAINGLISNILVGGLNTVGVALNMAVSPMVKDIPLIGSALNDIISPILGNLSGVSVSTVVNDIASAAGLSNVLNSLTSLADGASPSVVASLQVAIDSINNVYNFITPIIAGVENALGTVENTISDITANVGDALAPITNILNGTLSVFQNTLGSIIGTVEGALGLNNSASASTVTSGAGNSSMASNSNNSSGSAYSTLSSTSSATSSNSTSSSNTSSNGSSSVSDTVSSGSVLAATPSIIINNVTIPKGTSINPYSLIQSATDSLGNSVSVSDIMVVGNIPTKVPGQYILLYSFKDTANGGAIVSSTSTITVSSQSAQEMQSGALAAQTLASSAVSKDLAQITSLTEQINNLSGTVSDPTTNFTSTSNYPSSSVVVLPDPGSNFTPDVEQINSYFLQYINELREANGQPNLTYSSSEQAFAQQRAQQIVSNFSHTGANGSTEDIAASGQVVSTFKSNQEIAYYMVMDWYDESDNPEELGEGHWGHRANLLYGGPSMGIGFISLKTPDTDGFDSYYAFEAPQYTSTKLYNLAVTMSNSTTNPTTIPLPKLIFKYVDSTEYTSLVVLLSKANSQLESDKINLSVTNSELQYI